ncbi:conserved hypothetical protein [Mycobacterium tuberculosis T17]|nr:conserved hypothetical protein [Mycobacterium tuberculosis T17]
MRVRAGVRSSPLLLHAGTPPTAAAAESGMRTLVTGSSGHLGEALVRTLRARGRRRRQPRQQTVAVHEYRWLRE